MNPLLQSALGSILRWGLALGAGYLVRAGIWAAPDAELYVGAATLGLLSLGLSLWSKYHARLKLLTTLELAGATEHEVTALMRVNPSPPLATPPTSVPVSPLPPPTPRPAA
jgi:hypothetical protein